MIYAILIVTFFFFLGMMLLTVLSMEDVPKTQIP
jgi:hypothetical protein